ncbi:MAG: hypothetical protein HND57_14275 [Planctomycetes bacterium]|nr:hypothetical protein [Planctomycetota bacterium]
MKSRVRLDVLGACTLTLAVGIGLSVQMKPCDAQSDDTVSEIAINTASPRTVQCGRACAAVLLSLAEIPYSNAELESALPTDDVGTVSSAQILDFLQAKGLGIEAVQIGPSFLLEHRLPAILYEERPKLEGAVKQLRPHFVAVLGYDSQRICLFNPDTTSPRSGWLNPDAALQYWSGKALILTSTPATQASNLQRLTRADAGEVTWLFKWLALPALPWLILVLIRSHNLSLRRQIRGALSHHEPT